MRASCQVLIYSNLKKALQGMTLIVVINYVGVVCARWSQFLLFIKQCYLCAGDENGFIDPQYFEQVCEVHTGKNLEI